jgi:hypothetical protein
MVQPSVVEFDFFPPIDQAVAACGSEVPVISGAVEIRKGL